MFHARKSLVSSRPVIDGRCADIICRLHKRNFRLDNGDCTNDDQFKVLAFDAKEENGDILVLLPPADDLDAMIGSSKCRSPRSRRDEV